MSIVVKAGAGLAAGVVAGALGLAFLPRLEPSAVRPRSAVEKPQFVVASASPPAVSSPQPAATLAVATETPAARPAPPAQPAPSATATPVAAASPSPGPSPAQPIVAPQAPVAAAPAIVAKPVAVAKVETPVPVAAPTEVAPTLAAPVASADAARWSVRGLVALARGDISSARLFLTRAAEAGDARAWVALADTYDPAMLTKLGVVFAPGDAQRAKDCLVKAVAAGVVVPKDRLAALDQSEHPVR